jgi:hypothetical protein
MARNEPYQSIFYTTPFLYISKNVDGTKGRVLLFVFLLTRAKDTHDAVDMAQQMIQIVPADPFVDSSIIGSDSFDYSIWVDTVASVAQKTTIFMTTKVLPEGFWDLNQDFQDQMLEKLTNSALSVVLNMSSDSINTIMLEVSLDYAEKTNGAFVFERSKEYKIIRVQRIQEPKKLK